jgi:hypothetical protein
VFHSGSSNQLLTDLFEQESDPERERNLGWPVEDNHCIFDRIFDHFYARCG